MGFTWSSIGKVRDVLRDFSLQEQEQVASVGVWQAGSVAGTLPLWRGGGSVAGLRGSVAGLRLGSCSGLVPLVAPQAMALPLLLPLHMHRFQMLPNAHRVYSIRIICTCTYVYCQ